MVTSLDKTMVPLALKLLTKFGKPMLMTNNSGGTYDPTTSSVTNTNPPTQTVYGLPEEYAESIRFLGEKMKVPSAIGENDKKVTIASSGLAFVPAIGYTLQIDSDSFNIVGVGIIWSGTLPAVYVIHIRKT